MIQITDFDIDEVERAFRVKFDPDRRTALKCLETRDIRACPGSGKTTLLAAKLAILASKWEHAFRGICVLSHTNVASREIQRRFTVVPALQGLTSYPHFIGTLQSFIDQIFGIPGAIARFGVRPVVIDNEQYTRAANHEFFSGMGDRYKAAAFSIRKCRPHEPPQDWIAQVVYQDENFSLPTIGSKKKPIGPGTDTYTQIAAFKESLSRGGYFRFRDMDALAAWYLKTYPSVIRFLQWRFPLVFVDEAQDSIPQQAELIQQAFKPGSVIQRFGDDRQAIYNSDAPQEEASRIAFPSEEVLPMRHSHRMSRSIARLVSNVCCEKPEELTGNPKRHDRKHTVIVFARAQIDRVLPTFANIVAEEIGTGHSKTEVRAVGAAAKVRSEEHKFPSAIGDYWPAFTPPTHSHWRSRLLLDYLKRASVLIAQGPTLAAARDCLLDGMIRVLGIQGVTNGDRPFTRTTLLRWFQEQHGTSDYGSYLTAFLADACTQCATSENIDYGSILERFMALLSKVYQGTWNQRVTEFATSVDAPKDEAPPHVEPVRTDNVFRYEAANGPVAIEVGTIHSVKGETLRAILVLETFVFTHDLGELIEAGYLQGKRPTKSPGVHMAEHIRRIFVAMSRPEELLCLAVLNEHITDADRQAMESYGWRLVECGPVPAAALEAPEKELTAAW
jgi:DNA helicase II / ATP-dependent DNA helicase PcrA